MARLSLIWAICYICCPCACFKRPRPNTWFRDDLAWFSYTGTLCSQYSWKGDAIQFQFISPKLGWGNLPSSPPRLKGYLPNISFHKPFAKALIEVCNVSFSKLGTKVNLLKACRGRMCGATFALWMWTVGDGDDLLGLLPWPGQQAACVCVCCCMYVCISKSVQCIGISASAHQYLQVYLFNFSLWWRTLFRSWSV